MLVGYLGAGLAAKAFAPRIGLGTLVTAALLLDIVFWLFVVLHLEDVAVPGDFAQRHALAFDYPWSHSLAGALFWSAAAAIVWAWSGGEGRYIARAPAVIAATALSHWLIDVVVQPGGLPLWGPGAPTIGLEAGPQAALAVGLVIGGGGLALYLWRSRTPVKRRAAVAALVLAAALLDVHAAHDTVAPDNIMTLAFAALLVLFACVIVAAVADRERA
jgi:hypothetical protein